MSLYNMMFGMNPIAPVLLAALRLQPQDVGRFRDAYIDGNLIVVHTRNGGGNRECYCADYPVGDIAVEWKGETHRQGCLSVTNDKLAEHPQYVRDADDDFDCTYADFYFSFPPEYAEDLNAISTAQGEPVRPSEKWQLMLDALATKGG